MLKALCLAISALRDGLLSAASLDVFYEEPLPEEHPFWAMDNVHISAHMCGDVVGWRDDWPVSLWKTFSGGRPVRNWPPSLTRNVGTSARDDAHHA